ncbi:MAG: glycogen synthase [Myxococcota bacterium]
MNIIHISSEILPWSKAGGLGDVSGALPAALAARGHRVVTVAPRYAAYDDVHDLGLTGGGWLYGQPHRIRWFHARRGQVDHLFVDHPSFHRDGIYGDARGTFGDNLFRYALMCRASLQVPQLPLLSDSVDEDLVFHANDWHAGLVPLLLDAVSRPAGRYLRAASILALHNVAHHGAESLDHFDALDLAPRWRSTLTHQNMLSPLKGGVSTADQLVTVSPNYAKEITQTRGHGLEPLLAARWSDLHGIVNGVGEEWDPRTDPLLPAAFGPDDMDGKTLCKSALQKKMGLEVDPDAPVFGFIGRLVHQKGLDLLEGLVPWLAHRGAQVVLLGSGQPEWEAWMRAVCGAHPGRVATWVGYDEGLAHLITAGCDGLLMPSRFEPCGLNQLYAMRYGTVPLVHATGGLVDTVEPVDLAEDSGTGYRFWPYDLGPALGAADAFLRLYREDRAAFDRIRARGMAQRFDWGRAAASYESVYRQALERRQRISEG